MAELQLLMTLAERMPACRQRVLRVKQCLQAELLPGIGELEVQVLPRVRIPPCAWMLLVVHLVGILALVVASTSGIGPRDCHSQC